MGSARGELLSQSRLSKNAQCYSNPVTAGRVVCAITDKGEVFAFDPSGSLATSLHRLEQGAMFERSEAHLSVKAA